MSEIPLILLSPIIENKVEFAVFVEGTMSTALVNPFVRLVLEEENGSNAWYFPTRKLEQGLYESTVKVEPQLISSEMYRAYIEVILHDYYFVPVESLARFDTEIKKPTITMTELKGFKRRYTATTPVIRVNESKSTPRISVSVEDVRVLSKKPS